MIEKFATGDHLTDEQAMKLAIHEAHKGAGFVSPNPLVGCVILDSRGRLLSVGYHKNYGGPHAEVNALKGLTSEQLEGARMFVTLEPCAHEGKTPSCAKAIAKLPVSEVVYGLVDPNPLVAGQGAQILKDAGIKAVLFPNLKEDLEEVCEHFLMNFRHQRPFVSVKVASSLDGQMAMKSGESKWITGETARQKARYLRAIHDMTLVGKSTVLMDDPQLDIRHPHFPDKQNKLLVLDSHGECLSRPDLKLFRCHKAENLFFAVSEDTARKLGSKQTKTAQIIGIPEVTPGELDLGQLLGKIWKLGVKSVLAEGGARVISSFISHKEANRLYLFQAPILLGAKSGKPWSEQVSIQNMADRMQLRNLKFQSLDSDLLITGRLV